MLNAQMSALEAKIGAADLQPPSIELLSECVSAISDETGIQAVLKIRQVVNYRVLDVTLRREGCANTYFVCRPEGGEWAVAVDHAADSYNMTEEKTGKLACYICDFPYTPEQKRVYAALIKKASLRS